MDRDKKRALVIIILLSLTLIGSIIYFLWGNFINRGTLKLIGAAPFHVEIFGVSQHDCLNSPCEIKLKSGPKNLIISKNGAGTLISEAYVRFWRTTELNLNFNLLPVITETTNIPEEEIIPKYNLVFDENTRMQKLIKSDDPTKSAIVYFPQPLDDYAIIPGKNAVLVIDNKKHNGEGYIIDIKTNSREKITDSNLLYIEGGKWSPDGKYLIFKKQNSAYLWLLNSEIQNIQQLSLATDLAQTSWIYNDDLIFLSSQTYSSENDFEITLIDEKALTGFTFGIYHPGKNNFEKIGNFSEINHIPEKFITTSNGEAVYFQVVGKNFKINLQ